MYLVMMSLRGALVNMFYTENYRSSGGLVSVRDQGGWLGWWRGQKGDIRQHQEVDKSIICVFETHFK